MALSRRNFLWGLVAAAAIVHPGNLMRIKPWKSLESDLIRVFDDIGWLEEVDGQPTVYNSISIDMPAFKREMLAQAGAWRMFNQGVPYGPHG